jgi:hypothetical protein
LAAVPTVKEKFTTVIMFRFDTLPCFFVAVDLPGRGRRFGSDKTRFYGLDNAVNNSPLNFLRSVNSDVFASASQGKTGPSAIAGQVRSLKISGRMRGGFRHRLA